ncbi:MAG: phosphoribosylamine--glycine ligase, partial [Dehalococcoidia bacterium]|nr:phosphoribosylamine--glycine ligase [Dehalococcoidia bacterium]
MKVLVVGGGAREHAIVWKLKQSPRISEVFVAPGNAGTAAIARNLEIAANDIPGLVAAAESKRVNLTVVGPEGPLADGIVDRFKERKLAIFGPDKGAARIESSKSFAREVMIKAGVPCAKGEIFDSLVEARKYVERQRFPIVVKADGLASGKGVVVAQSRQEAMDALGDIMEAKMFGRAGDRVVIEECLRGREVSLLAFTDGQTVVPMVPACDHKRVFAGDTGPNTGGMGSYSPPLVFGEAMIESVRRTIMEPVIAGLASAGATYSGVLYAGLMMT